MKMYLTLLISVIQYYYGKLFWSKARREDFIKQKICKWHGRGYRFWYIRSPIDEDNGIYIITIAKDNFIKKMYLHKYDNTFIKLSNNWIHVCPATSFLPEINNGYQFGYYINHTYLEVDDVLGRINSINPACASGGIFKFILDMIFIQTYVPIYFGEKVTRYKIHRRYK